MNSIANQFNPAWQVTTDYQAPQVKPQKEEQQTNSFQALLKEKQTAQELEDANIHFSKHASQRLSQRNISLTNGQIERLSSGIEQARGKNINDSLVMVDDMAFIVNVKSNTVVTALGQDEQNKIFTNIDGAVIS